MSVTPDFVGQIYKDTNTGNLWRANSTTPGDWTLELQNMQVKWTPTTLALGSAIGFFTYANLSGLTGVIFSGTASEAGFDIEFQDDLASISFPSLVSIDPTAAQDGYLYITGCPDLTAIFLPVLVDIAGNLQFEDNATLDSLDISSVQTVGGMFSCSQNPLLPSLDASSVASIAGDLSVHTNTILASLDLSALTTLGGAFDCYDNPALTTVDISSLASFSGDLACSGCALNVASVDGILAQLVSIAAYGAGRTVLLNGGTNSAPTSTGVGSDYATLVARGANVSVN